MSIGEILAKINPVPQQREMSQSEYNKLVDINTKLVDKIKYQEKQIERLKANEEFFCKCITKAIEYLNQPYRDNFDYSRAELLDILQGVDKE